MILNLEVVDEIPLVPVAIKPQADEAIMWVTEKATGFYENNIVKSLHAAGRLHAYAAATMQADAKGDPTLVVFEVANISHCPLTGKLSAQR